ncbi:hypothetical protein IEO21_05273 [Rhodonia placenta]|uniref:DUF6535 domain-containing protein n=1 Tax=Rhodonia placenta TaxID=104341 RepID=A0A8H7P287_9APHY|nr:hypothetical protein IEO21_05273 [Postia placenta]
MTRRGQMARRRHSTTRQVAHDYILSGLRAGTWKLYIEQAIKQEEEYFKACNMEMDTMLLFATLFSGVLTAFVIESYPSLEPDTGDVAVQLLQQILVTLQANLTAPPTETIHVDQFFQPESSAVRVNSYWFAALVVSISTAFLTILAKQWLFSLSRGLASTEEMMGRQQQYRHDNLSVWRLAPILLALPVLLHISLLLFLIGLVEFLLPINKTVATVTGSLAAATILFYAITHIVSLVRPACPYRTSVTNVILACNNSFFREVMADWWSIKTVIEIRLPMFIRSWLQSVSTESLEAYDYTIGALGHPGLWRRKNKAWWSQKLSRIFTPQYWEDKYIASNAEEIDARALARMVKMFPRSEACPQLLVEDLVRFRGLVAHRDILLEAGAIGLIVRNLRSIYGGALGNLPAETREVVMRLAGALARIVTEAEEDDPRTPVRISGVPLPLDPAIASDVLLGDDGIRSLTASGLCVPDAPVRDHGNLAFFANMLRLHLVVSSDQWYWQPIKTSVEGFHNRILDRLEITNLGDEHLLTLVNTTIYIAMRPIQVESDSIRVWAEDRPQVQNSDRALEVLTAIMLQNPGMGHAVRRQICWGIWRCHKQIPARGKYIQFGSLIPIVAKTEHLAKHLADFLASPKNHIIAIGSPVQRAVLALTEGLVRSSSKETVEVDQRDKDQLLSTLTNALPIFLDVLCLQYCEGEISSLVSFFRQTTTICVLILSAEDGDNAERSALDKKRLLRSLCGLLVQVARGAGQPPAPTSRQSRTPSVQEKDSASRIEEMTPPAHTLPLTRTSSGASSTQGNVADPVHEVAVPNLDGMTFDSRPGSQKSDSDSLRRIAYGTACQIALLELSAKKIIQDVPQHKPAFDDVSTEALVKEGFLPVLHAAPSLSTYSEEIKTVLSIIATLSCNRDTTILDEEILRALRDPSNAMPDLLLRLSHIQGYKDCLDAALRNIMETPA